MWRSYLASALGNLARNRLYAAINILGLAIGMAAALLLALYIRDELTFDQFFPGWRNVYLLTVTETAPQHPDPVPLDKSPPYISPLLKLEFPQIQSIARVMPPYSTPILRRGEVETYETGFNWVDPDVFAVMPLKAVAGDPSMALRSPDAVVLTRAAARRYFGRDAPLGETLLVNPAKGVTSRFGAVNPYNTPHPMRVTAVVEDLPSNSSFKGEVFASNAAPFSNLAIYNATAGDGSVWRVNGYLLVRLKPGASAAEVRRGLAGFVARRMPASALQNLSFTLHLVPIADLHLSPPSATEATASDESVTRPRGDPKVIAALAAVAALIVLSASINFVVLMTAQAGRRAVETGVRKAAGAHRRDLIVQFLGEALIYVALAMAGAVVLTELFLPRVNAFLGRRMAFDYLHDPLLIATLVGAAVILGVGAGFYPALVLSAFRPAVVLKGEPVGGASGGAGRQALVALQFALMIGLIISTVTLWRQTAFALHSRLKVDGARVLLVQGGCSPEETGDHAFRELLAVLPGVQAQACSSAMAFNDFGGNVKVAVGGRSAVLIRAPIGFGYFEFYGLKPLAGRFLADGRGTDGASAAREAPRNPSVVINESAARRLGFASPAAAVGQLMTWTRPEMTYGGTETPNVVSQSEIVGVAPNFSTDARQPVPPRVDYYEPLNLQMLHVRLDGRRIPQTLEAIDKAWLATGHAAIHRRFLDQTLQAMYADVIVQSTAIGVGAGLALVIAALGLLGLAAHSAEQHTKEIGVRKAMGASTADIVRLLLWQFSRPVLVANLIAWPVAGWAMHWWLSGFAYHVDLPAWLFLAAGGAALLIACATVLTHALSVARASPATALRDE